MTFHNLQNSLIYRLKTQEIAFQRLCISHFPPTALGPLSLTARYGPGIRGEMGEGWGGEEGAIHNIKR